MKKNKLMLNYLYSVAYQIMLIILPLLTSPYISRILGAENIGIYSYTYSVVFYFGIFANLGINHYGNRMIAKCRDMDNKIDHCFSSLFILHAFLSLIIIFIYYGFIYFFVNQHKEIFIIQSIYLISVMFDISWFYFGIEEFKMTVGRNAAIKIVTTILIFLLVNDKKDLWIYTLILVSGTTIGNLSLWMFLRKYTKFVRVKINDIIIHFKPMVILAISVIAVSVYLYIDKIMLGNMSSMEQLGYFENAFKMIELPIGLITAMGTVMLPRMSNLVSSNNYEKAKQYIDNSMKLIALLTPAIAFGLSSVADVFSIVFWGDEFKECGSVLAILSIAALLITWNNIIRTEYLIPMERDKLYVKAVCSGALVNIILNICLIGNFGANGAAFGTVGAYFTVFIIQNLSVCRELNIKKYLKNFLPYMIIGLIMYCIIKVLNLFLNVDIYNLIFSIIVGACVYIVLSLIWINISNDEFFKKYLCNFKLKNRKEV